jgi:hypothetical protein
MKRRLLNLLTLVSLLLCGAAVALWVRSYWAGEAVFRQSTGEILTAAASLGQVRVLGGADEFKSALALYPKAPSNGDTELPIEHVADSVATQPHARVDATRRSFRR